MLKSSFSNKILAVEHIIVTGFVKNIREEYLKSIMNIVPMRLGAGTLNKIIESLMLGVPVIATPIAIEGFPDKLKEMITVASVRKRICKSGNKVLEITDS